MRAVLTHPLYHGQVRRYAASVQVSGVGQRLIDVVAHEYLPRFAEAEENGQVCMICLLTDVHVCIYLELECMLQLFELL